MNERRFPLQGITVLDLGQKRPVCDVPHGDGRGALEHFGVGYETLREVKPRLIYASGSGFGCTGPYREYPAMDITIQAMSGVMSVNGFPDGLPTSDGYITSMLENKEEDEKARRPF